MSEHTVKRIDDMEAVYLGAFKRARAELGIESFGMAIIDIPPNYEHYPEHDHEHDGQEEVFMALRGSGEIEVEEERHALDGEQVVRVGPRAKRKVYSGADGIRLLVLGGTPGRPYEPPELSMLGVPDPMAG